MPDLAQLLQIISQQNVTPQGPVPPGQPPLAAFDPKFGQFGMQQPLGSGYFPGKYQSAGNLPVEGEPYTGSMMQLGMEPQQVEVGSYSPFPGGPAVPLTETQMRVGGEIDPAVRMRLEEWSKLSPAQQEANALQVRRRLGLEEEAAAPAPAPAAEEVPRQPGDMDRIRARDKLDWLRAMENIGEGFGRMQVVTTGDVLHKTAKGQGLDTGYKPEALTRQISDLEKRTSEEERDRRRAKAELELEDRKQAGRREIENLQLRRAQAGKKIGQGERDIVIGGLAAIRELQQLRKEKADQGFNTGPIINKFEDIARAIAGDWAPYTVGFGAGGPDKAAFKNKAARIVRDYIFSLSGKQTSGQERQDLIALTPKGSDDDAMWEKNLTGLIDYMRNKGQVILESHPESTPELEQLRDMMEESKRAEGKGGTKYVRVYNTKLRKAGTLTPEEWERAQREAPGLFELIQD